MQNVFSRCSLNKTNVHTTPRLGIISPYSLHSSTSVIKWRNIRVANPACHAYTCRDNPDVVSFDLIWVCVSSCQLLCPGLLSCVCTLFLLCIPISLCRPILLSLFSIFCACFCIYSFTFVLCLKYICSHRLCVRASLVQKRTVGLAKSLAAESEVDSEEASDDKPVMVCIGDMFKVAGKSGCLPVFVAVLICLIPVRSLCLQHTFKQHGYKFCVWVHFAHSSLLVSFGWLS